MHGCMSEATWPSDDSLAQVAVLQRAGEQVRIGAFSEKGARVGSVIKKRRKKMRKHKQRKLLKRQRHKK